jgi:hypothetical protein
MPRFLKLASLVACTWFVLFLVGTAVARCYAPDFGRPNHVKAYIAKHIRYLTHARSTVRPSIDIGIGFTCDGRLYAWNPRTGTLSVDEQREPAGKAGGKPSPPISDPGIQGLVAGLAVPEARSLPGVLAKLAKLRPVSPGTMGALVGGVTGFPLGFWHSYASAPDCGSPVLKEAVEDTAFWRDLSDRLPLTKGMAGSAAPIE